MGEAVTRGPQSRPCLAVHPASSTQHPAPSLSTSDVLEAAMPYETPPDLREQIAAAVAELPPLTQVEADRIGDTWASIQARQDPEPEQ